jgi:hypothetical protein
VSVARRGYEGHLKVTSIRLHEDALETLRALSAATKRSQSELIRTAVLALAQRCPFCSKPSVIAAARRVVKYRHVNPDDDHRLDMAISALERALGAT